MKKTISLIVLSFAILQFAIPVEITFATPLSCRQEKEKTIEQQRADQLQTLNEKLKKNPNDTRELRARAAVYIEQGNFDAALKDYEKQYSIRSNEALETNGLAWFLATVPSGKHRNPVKAIELAKAACKKTDYSNAGYLDTLAAAFAANQDFDTAIITQKAALDAEKDPIKHRSKNVRLELYKAGKAVEDGFTNKRFVAVNNTSSSPVTLICTYWIDENNKAHSANYSWNIKASQLTDLLVGGKPFIASRVFFRVKTADGSTPTDATKSWISFESDLYTILSITQETIPTKVAAAKPAQKNVIEKVADEVAEIGRAIQENKEAIDDAKKLIEAFKPSVPQAPPTPRRAAISGDISLTGLVVASQKFDGTGWDIGFGKDDRPDISVNVVRTRGGRTEKAFAGEHSNTFEAFPNKYLLRVQEGDILKIEVYDNDALSKDLIGECQVTIDANFFQQNEINWTFGQVESFKLTITR